MNFAGLWTAVMAAAIAGYGAVLCASVWGGGAIAWALALPGAFVALQLLGLPVVLVGSLAERAGFLPPSRRSGFHEILLVALLVSLGWFWLVPAAHLAAAAFFALMYSLRTVFRARWQPGEPVEISK